MVVEGEDKSPEEIVEQVRTTLATMSPTQVEQLSGVFRHLIDHIVRRIEYAEGRRSTFATTGAGFIAAAIAILSIVARLDGSPFRALLATLAVGLLATGALVLVVWGRQTNPRYGFIKATTQLKRPWKWFYRDALEDSNAFDLHWWRGSAAEVNARGVTEFDKQWGAFAIRQLELADLKKDVLQDLKQTYLLHVNERYKNLFLSQIRTVLIWGLATSVLAALVALAIANCLE